LLIQKHGVLLFQKDQQMDTENITGHNHEGLENPLLKIARVVNKRFPTKSELLRGEEPTTVDHFEENRRRYEELQKLGNEMNKDHPGDFDGDNVERQLHALQEATPPTEERITIRKTLQYLNLKNEEDAVNHPSHYTAYHGLEIIDLTEQMNFNKGNAVKYICRAGLKDPDKEIEDLEKASWYLRREIARIQSTKAKEEPKETIAYRCPTCGAELDVTTLSTDFTKMVYCCPKNHGWMRPKSDGGYGVWMPHSTLPYDVPKTK